MECYDGESFSAVSYYFAKYLQEELEGPVGIINTAIGGTIARGYEESEEWWPEAVTPHAEAPNQNHAAALRVPARNRSSWSRYPGC